MLSIGYILAESNLDYDSIALLLMVCKDLRADFLGLRPTTSTVEMLRALRRRMRGISRNRSVLLGPASFVCVGSNGSLQFDVRIDGADRLRIYCWKYHYVNCLSGIQTDGRYFHGQMEFTTPLVSSVLVLGFKVPVDFPWWIHGIPRNVLGID